MCWADKGDDSASAATNETRRSSKGGLPMIRETFHIPPQQRNTGMTTTANSGLGKLYAFMVAWAASTEEFSRAVIMYLDWPSGDKR